MFQLVFTNTYLKREESFIRKHPELIERYKKILRLLELNPTHPSLRLHKLKGRFKSKYSVSITMSYRIILSFSVIGDEIILLDIGAHEGVYT